MKPVVRLLLLVAIVLGGTGLASAASGATPSSAGVAPVWRYDHHHSAIATRTTPERGPPDTYHRGTIYDTVDHRSCGASGRPDVVLPQPIHGYDHPAPLVQVASVASTVLETDEAAWRCPAHVERSRVAATCARACEAFQVVVSVTNPEVYLIGGWLDYKNGNGPRFTAIGASIPFGGALRLAGKLPILEKLGGSLSSAIHGISGDAAKAGTSAYDVAVSGGKHAGFLKNYLGRSTPEIERGVVSIERQIAEHQAKIQNPTAYIDDWATLDPRQQRALLTSKWPGDIARQQEQAEILRGILGGR